MNGFSKGFFLANCSRLREWGMLLDKKHPSHIGYTYYNSGSDKECGLKSSLFLILLRNLI